MASADRCQISTKEALPYQEITKTPYGIMCTTSWGGHLGWFEYGGGRWFVKPVSSIRHFQIQDLIQRDTDDADGLHCRLPTF